MSGSGGVQSMPSASGGRSDSLPVDSAGSKGGASNASGGRVNAADSGETGGSTERCDSLSESAGWEKITPPGDLGDSQVIQLDPGAPGTIYVQMHKGGNGAHYPTDGLYKSTDCGSTWTRLPQGRNSSDPGMPRATDQNINSGSLSAILIDPMDSSILYAVSNYGPGGVWKSLNGGVDWDQTIGKDVGQYINGLWLSELTMDPTDHRHIVAANHLGCSAPYEPNCLAETFDAGTTWHLITMPVGWAEANGVFIKDAKTMLFSAADLWLTTDGGASWSKVGVPGVGGVGNGNSAYQGADGTYYLASGAGVIASKDFLTWKVVGGGQYRNLRGTGENLITTEFYSFAYWIASEKDPSKWSKLDAPGVPANAGNGGVYMAYDKGHHLLYSSNFEVGLWRIVHR